MSIKNALEKEISELEKAVEATAQRLEPLRRELAFQENELASMLEIIESQKSKVERAKESLKVLSGAGAEHLKKVRFYETIVVSGLDVLGLSDPEGVCERLDRLSGLLTEGKKKVEPAPAPAVVAETPPVIVVEEPPAPSPVVQPPRMRRYVEKPQAETPTEWVVRMANMVAKGSLACLDTGHSPLQLLAAWSVKELTMEGRSNNYHVVGSYMMAEAICKTLKDGGVARVDLTYWREKMKSAASRACVSGLPIRQIDYTKANVPRHIGKTGSTKGFEWAPGGKSTTIIP
jgi:uncharacterized coiled-coil protein SlyX